MAHKITVAIDGPAGAGKSTVSKQVANELGYLYIDTGAMYRAVTWYVLQQNIALTNKKAIAALLSQIDLHMEASKMGLCVAVNGIDVTQAIRKADVTAAVSEVAAVKAVRIFLVEQQRQMAKAGGVILDGRDIGSVVLPKADLKIYLTASVETRAKRRWLEIKDKEKSLSLDAIKKSVEERDYKDMHRDESPLVCVPDAVVVDSSTYSFAETVQKIKQLIIDKEGKNA